MKTVPVMLVFVVSCSAISNGNAFPIHHESGKLPFTLEITANTKENHSDQWDFVNKNTRYMRSGSQLVVRIKKTNHSEHNLPKMPSEGGAHPYRFVVRDASGAIVKPKRSGIPHGWIIGGGVGSQKGSSDMALQPGQTQETSVVLSISYDLTKPGSYTIQVIQNVTSSPSSALVRSNIITVHVLPAKEALNNSAIHSQSE